MENFLKVFEMYPNLPKWLQWSLAILASVTGLSTIVLLLVWIIVALEITSEFLVMKKEQKQTFNDWRKKTNYKVAGYVVLGILATALSWLGLELKEAVGLGIPDWVFLVTPNGMAFWVAFQASIIILHNAPILGVPLPPLVAKGLKVYRDDDRNGTNAP